MRISVLLVAAAFGLSGPASGQPNPSLSKDEQAIEQQLRGLRSLPDGTRAVTTKRLATDIRRLPAGGDKLSLAVSL
jgi:hypothetical protein